MSGRRYCSRWQVPAGLQVALLPSDALCSEDTASTGEAVAACIVNMTEFVACHRCAEHDMPESLILQKLYKRCPVGLLHWLRMNENNNLKSITYQAVTSHICTSEQLHYIHALFLFGPDADSSPA